MIKIKKEKFIIILVSVALAAAALVVVAFAVHDQITGEVKVKRETYEEMAAVKNRYQKLYELQEKVNAEGLYRTSESKQMDTMYHALVHSLNDPYSAYMTKDEAESWDNAVNMKYYGVGISMEEEGRGNVVLQNVYDGTPADAAGLKKGDRLLKVDGKSYHSVSGFRQAIRSREQTEVSITYRRDGKDDTVKILRSELDSKSVYGGVLRGSKIGYIAILRFAEDTADDFRSELDDLTDRGVKKVIIDLRGNGGGYMDQAVDVADQLLPEGTITVTKNAEGKKKYYNSDETCTKMKYALLVNGDTASASEILASAVQDNHGGPVVGTKTYGKGVVQSEYHFGDGSGLRLTTMEYFSPKGREINHRGITPDHVVNRGKGSSDPQLRAAEKLLS